MSFAWSNNRQTAIQNRCGSRARDRPRQTGTRRTVAKEVVKRGGKPLPWGSEVWKSAEIGGTEKGSTRSTGRVGGIYYVIPYYFIYRIIDCIILYNYILYII